MDAPDRCPETSFSCRSARVPAITWTIAAVLVIETAALHLLLMRRVPIAAWCLTAMSLLALAWLFGDDRALRRADAVRVDAEHLHFAVGKRLRGSVPRQAVGRVLTPTWRDLAGEPHPLNATRPASPNVLVVLTSPQRVRVAGGLEREVGRIALHVDEPSRLVALLSGQS
jgi:hypothetical protein